MRLARRTADRLLGAPPGLIDVDTHAVDPQLPSLASYAGSFPAVERLDGDRLLVRVDDRPYREVDGRCWSVRSRLRDMDNAGVAVQLVSALPVTLCHDQPADGAGDLAAVQNDFLADLCAQAPDRLLGLGAVPLQDPDAAVRELVRCRDDLGFAGVQIGTRVGPRDLTHPAFATFFAAAAELGAVVLVHPTDEAGTPGGPVPLPAAAPGLRLLVTGSRCAAADRALWRASAPDDPAALTRSVQHHGPDRVVIGTDYPFAAPRPPTGQGLIDPGLDPALTYRVGRANAVGLLAPTG